MKNQEANTAVTRETYGPVYRGHVGAALVPMELLITPARHPHTLIPARTISLSVVNFAVVLRAEDVAHADMGPRDTYARILMRVVRGEVMITPWRTGQGVDLVDPGTIKTTFTHKKFNPPGVDRVKDGDRMQPPFQSVSMEDPLAIRFAQGVMAHYGTEPEVVGWCLPPVFKVVHAGCGYQTTALAVENKNVANIATAALGYINPDGDPMPLELVDLTTPTNPRDLVDLVMLGTHVLGKTDSDPVVEQWPCRGWVVDSRTASGKDGLNDLPNVGPFYRVSLHDPNREMWKRVTRQHAVRL